jgi:hypothetical protein
MKEAVLSGAAFFISETSCRIRHWSAGKSARILRAAWERVGKMRALLIAEGLTGLIAAVASYLWGYLDGRAEIRKHWRAVVDDLSETD